MPTNRFILALRLLLGMPVARLTFPPGITRIPGTLMFEGRGLEIRGVHTGQESSDA
jgi:hypothetical protein